MKHIAIIGAGPAGLMAAEAALAGGAQVSIYDAMPSVARKFLMAGKSGLNISHSEDASQFRSRYRAPDDRLASMIAAFGPREVEGWMAELGIESFRGSSGRVFPVMMKASPLLRAWLARLQGGGAKFHVRHRWQGWDNGGSLVFAAPSGEVKFDAEAVILALGGASWSRLGSDGAWAKLLVARGIEFEPFQPSNCGFEISWSGLLLDGFEGAPLKGVRLSAGDQSAHGDVIITKRGIESGAIYPLSPNLLGQIGAERAATLEVDLLPDVDMDTLTKRLAAANPKDSSSNRLRKAARLDRTKIALVNEIARGALPAGAGDIARFLKSLPIRVDGPVPMDEAISTAGGVSWNALDDQLMLKALPGVYCAGEMVAWDAPTGGYLLTACLAMGRAAGRAAARR
ncbi:TIGR03862 family flavoprotein [Henriciella barbarensis]|uniref:TIGR03862 family flavoprotein n=1 Tax=Henriciella barbarensis TaxID=86342 RepID=A0A399QTH6_9PROT|nr:TIGR03862 family flavoprotein [Henriciella barbarensis]RIJ22266.1 TIGR03862 family flavoprotein [Henriciella barbarensis]